MIYRGYQTLRRPIVNFELHDALIREAVEGTAREVERVDEENEKLKKRVEKLEKPDKAGK
jgi:hypothetical protein